MKTQTIQELKARIDQAPAGCCFSGMELLLLRSLLPKQEYIVKEKVMITCALPVSLIRLANQLVKDGRIESVSSLLRLALVNYARTKWVPPLPKVVSKKVDYSFRVEQEILKEWRSIKGNRARILASWGWFLGIRQVRKLPTKQVNFILLD